jgi:exopolyphosphatase/guanosine-5'-triphosphate,3'-diphosphate pyrophosphatase
MDAVVDIGTNSCRLIIVEKQGVQLQTFCRQLRITRIGRGQNKSGGELTDEGMESTLKALLEYQKIISEYSVGSFRLLGTQALRVATNAEEFKTKVKQALNWNLEIISGEREAYLSYLGAISALPDLPQAVVLDIGGGSTEVMTATAAGVHGASAPIGCLRLLENPLSNEAIKEVLKQGWHDIQVPEGSSLVGVGGTATTIGTIFRRLAVYDPEVLLEIQMTRQDVQDMLDHLISLTSQQRLALPGMLPAREDILPWGIRILLATMDYFSFSTLRICDRDLMYGILLENC